MFSTFAMYPTWFYYVVLILVSACVGSFLNVVSFRLPLMLTEEVSINLFKPRSFCPKCQQKIAWYDNVPVLNYAWLQGHCRNCKIRISPRYPLTELTCVLMSVFVYHYFGATPQMFAALLFTWWLIPMAIIDMDHTLLPDQLTLSLLWIGLLLNVQSLFTSLSDAVLGAAFSYIALWVINSLYCAVRKKDGLGQGDWKLLAAFGAWFGYIGALYILAFAAILGAVFGVGYMITKKVHLDHAIPFGPFLCVAAWLWLFKSTWFLENINLFI